MLYSSASGKYLTVLSLQNSPYQWMIVLVRPRNFDGISFDNYNIRHWWLKKIPIAKWTFILMSFYSCPYLKPHDKRNISNSSRGRGLVQPVKHPGSWADCYVIPLFFQIFGCRFTYCKIYQWNSDSFYFLQFDLKYQKMKFISLRSIENLTKSIVKL